MQKHTGKAAAKGVNAPLSIAVEADDREDEKSVKTAASRPGIPIHQTWYQFREAGQHRVYKARAKYKSTE